MPFFSLALPFLWSERPSLLLALVAVYGTTGFFHPALPLSIAASFLSSLLLLLGTLTTLLRGLVDDYIYSLRTPKLEAVMNSRRNALGMRETEIAREPR